MDDWQLNEYVYEDRRDITNVGVSIIYEPLEYDPAPFELMGHIYFDDGQDNIGISVGSTEEILLIGSDEVLVGYLRNRKITLLWKQVPIDHALCVSYRIDNEETPKANWMQEGF